MRIFVIFIPYLKFQSEQKKKKKKSLAQEMHQKRGISECRSKCCPLQPLLCLQHVQLGHCATCQGSPYTKNECRLFYQKFDAEYFFIQQFFRKKLYFQRKPQKIVLGGAFDNFLEKEGVLRRKLT